MKNKIDETALVPPSTKSSRRSLTLSDSKSSNAKPVVDTVSASSTSSLSSLRGEDLLMTSTATISTRDQPDFLETATGLPSSSTAVVVSGVAGPPPQQGHEHTSSSTAKTARKKKEPRAPQRVGRWTMDEKLLFLYGLRKFGKGRWKKISVYLPDRYVKSLCSDFV